jgi:hypothetical protein
VNYSRTPLTQMAEAATSRPARNGATAADERAAGTARAAQPPDGTPPVIYIAGSGRSGSTMLERVLGEIPGFVNVGELIDLFRHAARHGERCGCGELFADCPFWTSVGKRAFGGWDTESVAEVRTLLSQVSRQRRMPQLLTIRLASRDFREHVAAYGARYASLYRVIAAEAGADYVVDASKWPVQALALARGGLDVRVIHLVRDVRGVSYSLGKQQARPHAVDENDLMWRNAPAGAAARWVACQGQAELLRGCGLRVARVHYEDFVREPRRTVEVALSELGLQVDPAQLSHIGDGRVVLGHTHGLSGNPSRFRYGEIVLRADEAWRDQMRGRDRRIVTMVAAPFLLRYGRRRAGGAAQAATASAAPASAGTAPASAAPASAAPASAETAVQAAPAAAPMPERAEWPLVSVIVPTRGRPELVRQTIAAVVAQTYPGDIECIVVHDQESPDEELAALGTARRSIRVVSNTHTPGLAGARNTGLAFTSGEFVAGCDDDDLWHPDKLQRQVDRLLSEPDLIAVGSGIRLLLPGDKTLEWPGRADRISYELLLRNRVKELHSSTLVMRREAFDKAGGYDEELPYGYSEDYDWVLRLARVGGVGLLAPPLADIRRNATSWYQGGSEKVAAGLEYLLAKHPDIAKSRRGHARLLGQIAFAKSALGQRGQALRLSTKAIIRYPPSPYPYIALVHTVTRLQPSHMLRAARLFRREMA